MSEPRSEPEIIPPDRERPEWRRNRSGAWIAVDAQGTRRIYIRRIGPGGFILLALLVAVFAALVFVVLVGAVLLWIPVAILLVLAALIGGMARRYMSRRLR
jgi:hypothetical protein